MNEAHIKLWDSLNLTDPGVYILHTHCVNFQLILLAISHHLLVKFSRLFNLFELIDGGVAQLLQGLHSCFRNAKGQVFFRLADCRYLGGGFGFHLREADTWNGNPEEFPIAL